MDSLGSLYHNKEVVSTFFGHEGSIRITSGRREGNTTRIIDRAIQLLFEGKAIRCHDYHDHASHLEANRDLFKRIIKRLVDEHFIFGNLEGHVYSDYSKLLIALK